MQGKGDLRVLVVGEYILGLGQRGVKNSSFDKGSIGEGGNGHFFSRFLCVYGTSRLEVFLVKRRIE